MDSFFGTANARKYSSALHGRLVLTKSVWRHVVEGHGEFVRLNANLIKPTLADPCEIRQSQHPKDKDTYVYYSRPKELYRKENVTVPAMGLQFAVVVDAAQGRIKTIYFARTRIPGKVVYKK
ncbi:MAG TPA: hypothetical protein VM223_05235 [Planctomycetota bacterium]|nr:hypothetical protein [Planctomycetota bacterium]